MNIQSVIVTALIVFSSTSTGLCQKPTENVADKAALASKTAVRGGEKTKIEKAAVSSKVRDEVAAHSEEIRVAKENWKESNTKERLKEHLRKLSEEQKESIRSGGRPRE